MPLTNIFPLSLYNSKIELSEMERNKLVKYILDCKSSGSHNRYKENTFAWTGDQEGHGNIHNQEIFQNLFVEVKNKVLDYLDLLFIDHTQFDIYFQRSWATVSHSKEFIGRHSHMQSHLSFAYYLKKNQNDSKIIFWDTNKANEFIPELFDSPTIRAKKIIKKKDLCNSSKATIEPKEGDIIIFPSKIFHSTEQNKENNERISISADISFFAKDQSFLEHLTPPFSNWKKF
tara:strand:- start:87 stop:779 length:693 start_codon:yes stop_codon:yes gene_type:complete